MDKVAFFANITEKTKNKFDLALVKNRDKNHKREQVLEQLLKYYAQNGLPE